MLRVRIVDLLARILVLGGFHVGEGNYLGAIERHRHEVVPQARGGYVGACRRVIAIAHPCGTAELRAIAHEPVIAVLDARARLAGNGLPVPGTCSVSRGIRFLEHAPQHVRDGPRHPFVHHAFRVVLRLVEHLPVFVLDARDDHVISVDAPCGQGAVGFCHLKRRDVFGAERDDGVGRQIGVNAHSMRHLDDLVGAYAVGEAVVTRVRGNGGCIGECARAVRCAAEVADGLPRRKGDRARAVDGGFRAYARFDCGSEGEHLERRTRWTPALRGDVPLVLVKALSANQGFHVSVTRVDRHERCVHARVHVSVLVVACLLCLLLHVHVKSRVNLQTALEKVGI